MKRQLLIFLITLSFAISISAQETDTVTTNNWGTKLRESNFHVGLDLQTKYVWRGMEMITTESSPVLFPSVNYQYKGIFLYAMGGYAINAKYAEVDLGASYAFDAFTVGIYDYYYPTIDTNKDEYLGGGKNTGHWLEAAITYSPNKLPIWITASNFFYGADKYIDGDGKEYYYKVSAIDVDGIESLLPESPIYGTTLKLPATPVMEYARIENGQVVLRWAPTDDRSVEYVVYKSDGWFMPKTERFVGIKDVNFYDREIVPGKKYYYSVAAVDRHGLESKRSNEVVLLLPQEAR